MGKIVILGSEESQNLQIQREATILTVPFIKPDDWGVINNFIEDNLKDAFDLLIIDADNIQSHEIALAIAVYVRLSAPEIKKCALSPIVFLSDLSIKQFLHIKHYAQILLTEGVYFQSRTNIILDALESIDPSEYRNSFLECINIPIPPEFGHHSLANQWGASVLSTLIQGDLPVESKPINDARKTLYFKYTYAKTINDWEGLINSDIKRRTKPPFRQKISAVGKRVLLIDDEAEKGWGEVLKAMLFGCIQFEVISERVPNYKSFSTAAIDKIEKNDYDLIFLDLRMNGIKEEDCLNPESFSGMDILKNIKNQNKGTQVIMFTASNKAWNMKALLDAGADGYYIKESPELSFPLEVSESNYNSLCHTVKRCFDRGYLRDVYRRIKNIKEYINNLEESDAYKSILQQLDIAFYLANTAETPEQHAFSYISLYQIIEIINHHLPKSSEKKEIKYFSVECELSFNNKPEEDGTYLCWDNKKNRAQYLEKRSNSPEILLSHSIRDNDNKGRLNYIDGKLRIQENIDILRASEFIRIANFMKEHMMDNNHVIDIHHRIRARNWFIHQDKRLEEKKNGIERQIYSKEGFSNLFKHIERICLKL